MAKTLQLLILLLSTALFDFASCDGSSNDLVWHKWKKQHQKQYSDSLDEQRRRDIWQQKVDEITEHNLRYEVGLETYKKGLNHFSDLSWNELKQIYLSSLDVSQAEENDLEQTLGPIDLDALPDLVDWREKGYVTAVKNQGGCGSCWTFSTTGTLEGQLANKTRQNATSLSEQQIVDCDKKNSGCNGGWPYVAVKYTQENGIEGSGSYPYIAKQQNCTYNASNVVFNNSDSLYIYNATEARLQEMVALRGPVSVCVQVTGDFFGYKSYIDRDVLNHLSTPHILDNILCVVETLSSTLAQNRHGVFTTHQCTQGVNHAVLAAGYGTDLGKDYWLVKNSWGPGWGESGYIRMARNKGNMCNIAYYPVVAII